MRTPIYLAMGCILMTAIFLTGCNHRITEDLSELPRFHELNFPSSSNRINPEVDLYVDYSTCVAEAMESPYYRAVHPAIVDSDPTFFSIKGSEIKEETSDRQEVYTLLNSVKEINYAEIRGAVGQIVEKNKQAVIITDGEYFRQGATRDNLNNPYLADHFRTWLKKGYDIYIYNEPYVESGKHDKQRYYMIFTDSRLENNIQQKFERNAPSTNSVGMFHLSNSLPAVRFSSTYPQMNPALSFHPGSYIRKETMECQEYQTPWNDIYNYILRLATDPEGNPLPNGDYILRGIYLDNPVNTSYHVKEVEAITYHVYEPYQALLEALANEGKISPAESFERADHIFVVDQKAFQETGEIILRLNPDFDGTTLKKGIPNLLKVDLVLKKSEENFTKNINIHKNFKWISISEAQRKKENNSIYESIKQLLDGEIAPENYHKNLTIYTIYLSTLAY